MRYPFLHTYATADDVLAFSTTREGGVSTENYASFNVNNYCGDQEECVARNRQLLCKALQIDVEKLILPHQTHHAKVVCVDEAFLCLTPAERCVQLEGVDALITACSNVCVAVSTADCVPLLFYDPVKKVVAAVHAGWRGTVLYIAKHVVSMMQSAYASHPQDLEVYIGPSISLSAFEVGDEVYEAFAAANFSMEQIACRYPSGKWHLDLWEANLLTLSSLGVKRDNIHVSGICSYEQYTRFFSARRLTIKSGRIVSGILLK
ncbi:MAG: peptidoglycan editing factor PgeF [Bacteroidaceae bacterium]